MCESHIETTYAHDDVDHRVEDEGVVGCIGIGVGMKVALGIGIFLKEKVVGETFELQDYTEGFLVGILHHAEEVDTEQSVLFGILPSLVGEDDFLETRYLILAKFAFRSGRSCETSTLRSLTLDLEE